jgi:hypothetical protein
LKGEVKRVKCQSKKIQEDSKCIRPIHLHIKST